MGLLRRLALLALMGLSNAMFEDQVDKIDWCAICPAPLSPSHSHVQQLRYTVGKVADSRLRTCYRCTQHIGKVTHSIFHSTGPHRLALVATEQSVLAGVDLRHGTIVWRQVLRADEKISGFQQHGKVLLSLGIAPGRLFIRLWSTQGSLVWDAQLLGSAEESIPAPTAAFVGSSIVVAWKSTVVAFHGTTGAQLW